MISMKKFRKIEIKNPKLQKIRNEFRRLIFLECKKRKKESEDKKWAIIKNPDGSLRKQNKEEIRMIAQLNSQFWAIENPLRHSIILCRACGKLEGDRIYHPKSNSWHCLRCFEYFHEALEDYDKTVSD